MVTKDTGFGIGSKKDGSDVLHTSRISGHQIFPQRALAGLDVDAIHVGRQFSRLVDVKRMAVGAPGDGLLALIDAGNQLRVPTVHRVKVASLVGTNGSDHLRVRRDRERVPVHALRRDGAVFACVQIVDVKLFSPVGLVA